jgi:hypothetical protein
MVDLYSQFAAWVQQPLVLTNWVAALIFLMVFGSLYIIGRTLQEILDTIVTIANRLQDKKITPDDQVERPQA